MKNKCGVLKDWNKKIYLSILFEKRVLEMGEIRNIYNTVFSKVSV